jgi:hypothetical protein
MDEKIKTKWYKTWWGVILIIFGFFVLISMITSPSGNTPKNNDISNNVVSINKNTIDFFLSGNDLSTEWRYGLVKDESIGIRNNITPIEVKKQYNTFTEGLSTDTLTITVYKFENSIDSKGYYSGIVDEIISERGYTEVPIRKNCFAKSVVSGVIGEKITAYCNINDYLVKTSYYVGIGCDRDFFDSIISKIHS